LLIIISTGLFLGAVIFYLLSVWLRNSSRIPSGEIIYADSHNWQSQEKSLFDETILLIGKPDYIIRNKGVEIPVEVKSKPIFSSPYESHKMQIAAYCRLTHISSGKRPPYGILQYANHSVKINYTNELENKLLQQIDTMQIVSAEKTELHRSHNSVAKCKGCAFSRICDENLM
jgi:CRISPR-associated exonuclease Cas4